MHVMTATIVNAGNSMIVGMTGEIGTIIENRTGIGTRTVPDPIPTDKVETKPGTPPVLFD
jgi:hypothetical protein